MADPLAYPEGNFTLPNADVDEGREQTRLSVLTSIAASHRHNPRNLESMSYGHANRIAINLCRGSATLNARPQFEVWVEKEAFWRADNTAKDDDVGKDQDDEARERRIRALQRAEATSPTVVAKRKKWYSVRPDFAITATPYGTFTGKSRKALQSSYNPSVGLDRHATVPVLMEWKRRAIRKQEDLDSYVNDDVELFLSAARMQLMRDASLALVQYENNQDIILLIVASGEYWQFRLLPQSQRPTPQEVMVLNGHIRGKEKPTKRNIELDIESDDSFDEDEADLSGDYDPVQEVDVESRSVVFNEDDVENEDEDDGGSSGIANRVEEMKLRPRRRKAFESEVAAIHDRSDERDTTIRSGRGEYILKTSPFESYDEINEHFCDRYKEWSDITEFGTIRSNQQFWRIRQYLEHAANDPKNGLKLQDYDDLAKNEIFVLADPDASNLGSGPSSQQGSAAQSPVFPQMESPLSNPSTPHRPAAASIISSSSLAHTPPSPTVVRTPKRNKTEPPAMHFPNVRSGKDADVDE
ncbi:unnamed protein product [Somion occarium]|uniref:Uncharacterized protein n=2 Tax=Somion occarium TaxID=3059160 RepID=A0ABP1CXX9_9APHY